MTSVDSTLARVSSSTDIAEIRAIVERDGGVII